PHALLRYALLVLGSQSYQRLFDVALHLDYPRLPPPLPDLWGALEQAGERLEAAFLRPAIEEGERLRIGHRALDRLPAGLREALREGEALVGELLGRQGLRPPSCDLGRGVGADEA
ncbi:MAG: hypothetical protein OEY14_18475, partial [Myxococcales bacterium]|nr:hypothetical protein [Myxococcales bacterium]